MPITFQALFAPDRLAVQFAIKTVLGGGLALWLALRWGLEQPSWALMTAFIVAQPLSGMVVQKGLARLLGTLVGTVMSVIFMSLFAQTPWLFLLALALWLGLCTACSTLLRSAWSYSFVLAGYTVAIIALPAITHPLAVFDQAVARCTEISLGIVCATAASALLWPLRVERQLAGQAHAAWQSGMQAARATLAGDAQARKGLLEILGRIVAVDAQREHAWFEGSLGRQRARAISGLSQKLLMLLRIARSVRRQWKQLEPAESEALAPWMNEVQRALDADSATLQALRPRVLDASHDPLISSAQSYCLARFALLLDTALAACAALAAVREGRESADPPRTLTPHRDLSLAMVFGARSALAFLAVSCFWLATAWPAAGGALVLTCVVCSLFASRENGAQIGMSFLRGILLAVPTAFVVGEILLPQWSSFAMLCMAMGVPLFFGALGMAKPPIFATATSFCLHFVVLISPLNAMKYDVAAFFNNAQAMMIGVGAAVLAFNLLILRDPAWHGRRLLAATLDDLVRLTRRNLSGAESWFGGRMADRLLQLARHYPELPVPSRSRWDDGLLGLDIGDELLHLRLSLAVARVSDSRAQRRYFEALEQVLERGPSGEQADALAPASAEFLKVLSTEPPGDALKLAQGAVVQLQNSWRAWCRQHEPERREHSHGLA
ncbi:FUSC family protein [Pseudomonas corrugata]|uniref:FUSC family protein n=1 Tax=Pseudomonas corrugata TaxID=47879 RepID=A0A8B6UUT0_9PSED|nr:FUSC family protein [Pseudomonas corrugata]AOE64334.1 fusaric acid resistance protein [Pseudomonas corrugata]MDU9036157.1 FUSC family protein [Pseudomonas corrugata]QTH15657.1 FUSC family protein [Pseudomonas corrugata]UZE07578.1 FUSC family protein [Pseudomonas corrugata]